jgi:hypothetical protein
MRYALLINFPQPTVATVTDEAMEAGKTAFRAYAKALTEAGVLCSAEMFQPAGGSTSIAVREGKLQMQERSIPDNQETLAGIFVLDVDAAIEWAGKCPAAQWGSVEIRASAMRVVDGEWERVS